MIYAEQQVHVFNYPTHAATWTLFIGPAEAATANGNTVPTADGGQVTVYYDMHLTEAAAHKSADETLALGCALYDAYEAGAPEAGVRPFKVTYVD